MKFTETHEWVDQQNDFAVVGITQFAQKELGDIVYVELPKIGREVKKGQEAAILESTKAAADVYSPLSGEIVEVNPSLSETPELVNTSPEKEGWLFKLKISNPKELESLMSREAYESGLTH